MLLWSFTKICKIYEILNIITTETTETHTFMNILNQEFAVRFEESKSSMLWL